MKSIVRTSLTVALVTLAVQGLAPTPPGAAAPQATANVGALENARRIRVCVNRERAARGIAPLHYDRDLAQAARLHARNMKIRDFFAHDDPFGRGPAERVARFTSRYGSGIGENIALGPPSARAACAGWMRSPSHRANILHHGYVAIGTGYAGGQRYWVQVFAFAPAGE